jgi:hypothetical protein
MHNDCWLSPIKNVTEDCIKGYTVLDESMKKELGKILVFKCDENFEIFVKREDFGRRKVGTFENKEEALDRVNLVAYELKNA